MKTVGKYVGGVQLVMGVPLYRWMVKKREHPNLELMIWGYPPCMETPIFSDLLDNSNEQELDNNSSDVGQISTI